MREATDKSALKSSTFVIVSTPLSAFVEQKRGSHRASPLDYGNHYTIPLRIAQGRCTGRFYCAKFIIWCNRVKALLHALLYGKEKGGDELKRAYRYLTFEDRKQIERLWSEGATPKEIACTLGVHFTTVYDELKRGDTGQVYADFRNVYDASLAQQTVKDSLKRKGRHRQAV